MFHIFIHDPRHRLVEFMLNEKLAVKAHDPYHSVGTMGLVEIGEEEVGANSCDETRQNDNDELHRHAGSEPKAQKKG